MTDARSAFHELRASAGTEFDARHALGILDEVEPRIAHVRARRAALSSVIGVFVVGLCALLVARAPWSAEAPPIDRPTASPSPTATTPAAPDLESLALPCTAATVVPGKSVGELAGFEGWFNGQAEPSVCESSDAWNVEIQRMADHPETVWINTMDGTMIEAYYRTSFDALGVYGTLNGDFIVPNPDSAWPADSAVLIDARTGEVLQSQRFDEIEGFDVESGHFVSEDSGAP